MSNEINYKNNPLHGVGLKKLLTEIVDQYGFQILFAYLNINCFRKNPSIDLYQFKSLPRASTEQFSLPPRDRIIPEDQTPGDPRELSLEDAERLREKHTNKSVAREKSAGQRSQKSVDPWANWKNRSKK
ncbi:MAG: VF530 family DNA-binding protein [Candidatus Thiodiazotropha sp. 6PLUC3]